MSFDKLASSSVAKKSEEIVFTVDGKRIVFTANELNMTQRIKLAQIDADGGDTFLHWIVFSILDEDGKKMSFDQASQLSDETLQKFLAAAIKVNSQPGKDIKKKGKRKRNK